MYAKFHLAKLLLQLDQLDRKHCYTLDKSQSGPLSIYYRLRNHFTYNKLVKYVNFNLLSRKQSRVYLTMSMLPSRRTSRRKKGIDKPDRLLLGLKLQRPRVPVAAVVGTLEVGKSLALGAGKATRGLANGHYCYLAFDEARIL